MSALRGASGLLVLASVCIPVSAQEADAGFSLPVTITGGALYTRRTQIADPAAGRISAAFHAVLYPSLKLRDRAKTTSQLRVDRVVPLRQRVMVLQAK
jgi:hypothetical protein